MCLAKITGYEIAQLYINLTVWLSPQFMSNINKYTEAMYVFMYLIVKYLVVKLTIGFITCMQYLKSHTGSKHLTMNNTIYHLFKIIKKNNE